MSQPPPRQPKKGMRINNAASTAPRPPEPIDTKAFEKDATEAFRRGEDYKQRFWDLSQKLKSIMLDQTLSENRTSITKDLEMQSIRALMSLAQEMDDDEQQANSEGTRGMAMLLLKFLLMQKDTINQLAYRVEQLERAPGPP